MFVGRAPRDTNGRREVTVLADGSTETGATPVGDTGEPGGSASA